MVPIAQAVQVVKRSDADWKAGMVDPNNLPAIVIKRELLAAAPEARAAPLEQVEVNFRVRIEAVLAAEDEAVSVLQVNPRNVVGAAKALAAAIRGPQAIELVKGPLAEEAGRRNQVAKAEAEAKAKAEAEKAAKGKPAPTTVPTSVPELTEVEANIVKMELGGDHDGAVLAVYDVNLNGERDAEQVVADLVAKHQAIEAAETQAAAVPETLTEQEAQIVGLIATDEKKARIAAIKSDLCGKKPEDWQKYVADLKAKAARIAQAERAKAPSPEQVAKRTEDALISVCGQVRKLIVEGKTVEAAKVIADALSGIAADPKAEAESRVVQELHAMIREKAAEIGKALEDKDLTAATIIFMGLGLYPQGDAFTPEEIRSWLETAGAGEAKAEAPAPAQPVVKIVKTDPAPAKPAAQADKVEAVASEETKGGDDAYAKRRAELDQKSLKGLIREATEAGIEIPDWVAAAKKQKGDKVPKAMDWLKEAIIAKEFEVPGWAMEAVRTAPVTMPSPLDAPPAPETLEEAKSEEAKPAEQPAGFRGQVEEPAPAEAAQVAEAVEPPAQPEPEPEDEVEPEIPEGLGEKLARMPLAQRARALRRLGRGK